MKRFVTQYGGFLTIGIEWFGFFLCIYIHPLDWNEPCSQYGYYVDTRILFGIGLTIASLVYYIYSRTLDRYWKYTSLLSLMAGICLSIMGWIPYQPYVQTFVFDVHNLCITFAMILYSLPMIFIGFKKRHHMIGKLSRIFFVLIVISGLSSIIARAAGARIIPLQLFSVSVFHVWIICINIITMRQAQKDHQQASLQL